MREKVSEEKIRKGTAKKRKTRISNTPKKRIKRFTKLSRSNKTPKEKKRRTKIFEAKLSKFDL